MSMNQLSLEWTLYESILYAPKPKKASMNLWPVGNGKK